MDDSEYLRSRCGVYPSTVMGVILCFISYRLFLAFGSLAFGVAWDSLYHRGQSSEYYMRVSGRVISS